MKTIIRSPWLLAGATLLLSAFAASAGTVTPIGAIDSAEITTAGPTLNGFYHDTSALNILGSGNTADSNAPTFGVIDFANLSPDPMLPIGSVNPDFTLSLTNTASSAASPGVLDFYLVTDTTTSLDSLTYSTTATPNGLGNQLGTDYFLGTGNYSTSGSLLTYNLSLPNSAAENYAVNQFNNPNGDLRLAITSDTSGSNPNTVGATFAGANTSPGLPFQFSATAPVVTFSVTAVPEANTPALLLVGLLGLAAIGIARRRA